MHHLFHQQGAATSSMEPVPTDFADVRLHGIALLPVGSQHRKLVGDRDEHQSLHHRHDDGHHFHVSVRRSADRDRSTTCVVRLEVPFPMSVDKLTSEPRVRVEGSGVMVLFFISDVQFFWLV